jgi:hypothetical protein
VHMNGLCERLGRASSAAAADAPATKSSEATLGEADPDAAAIRIGTRYRLEWHRLALFWQ